jgi:hypothetical protein
MKTFQEFNESAAIARGALRLLKSASKAGKVARTADGGRRVTSAARATRTATPRAVSPRGPSETKWQRLNDRVKTSNKVALKKAGFKRRESGEEPKGTESWASDHHTTAVNTYKNQSDYVIDQIPYKRLGTGQSRSKVTPTASRVRPAKALRKQLGGDRTSKPVHDVAILNDTPYGKNDPYDLISRGRSFKKEILAVPDALKKAGAKPGDKVTAEPSAMMSGEDPIKGKQKRDKIYTKALKAKMNPKTGKTMGTYRDIN